MATDFNGYLMKGVDGEYLFVVRTYKEKDILSLLEGMQEMRSQKHRELARRLLKEFYARED